MERIWLDLRYAVRVLRGSPSFTTIAVMCLALGIGANTAVFSVVNAVLLRPLAYHTPDRLVAVFETLKGARFTVCPADFQDWREQAQSFESLAAYQAWSPNLTGVEEPELLAGMRVSGDLFRLLGVAPVAGRVLLPDDERQRARSVVVSYSLWQRRFGGDISLVGRSLKLSDEGYLVVGIMPPEFQFPSRQIELWTPLALDPSRNDRGEHSLSVVGRLRSGVSWERANTELAAMMQRLRQQFPTANASCGADLIPLRDSYTGGARRTLWTLLGAVALVLLMACANVANLLLARGSARQQELLIRSSLGAGRSRLATQLLTECLVLGLLGGSLGLILAAWSRDALIALLPEGVVGRFGPVLFDGRVFVYTLLASLASGVIFGLVPAVQASRLDPNPQQATARVAPSRLRGVLLAAQAALAVILLAGAGLLIQSFARLWSVDPGFSPGNVMAARINLPARRYAGNQAPAFYEQVLARLSKMPGVRAAGAASFAPLGGGGNSGFISFEGRPAPPPGSVPGADRFIVAPGYFEALQVPLREGRLFTAQDASGTTPVVIVNQTMAERYWPNESPVGRRIKRGTLAAPFPWMTVVGVVGDIKQHALNYPANPTVYLPQSQTSSQSMTLVVRGDSDQATLAAHMRAAVRFVDRDQPLTSIRSLDDLLWSSLAGRRLSMLWMVVFAGLALILAAAGVHGVVTYAVARRTREFGIRMALGAESSNLRWLAIRQGMVPVLSGIVIGVAAATGLTRFLSSQLFAVTPTDVPTFAGAVAVLGLVALAASSLAARRIVRLDPTTALRCE